MVLELLGSIPGFELAAQALGLEWLGSMESNKDGSIPPSDDEDSAAHDEMPSDEVADAKVFYLTMPSEQGLRSLLAAWNRFSSGDRPRSTKETPLWNMFAYLKDLRTWSSKDRVDPILARYVRARLEAQPEAMVSVEVDLWYRNEKQRRDQAFQKLTDLTTEVGGILVDQVEIPEIQYQGVLVQVPGSIALQMIDGGNGSGLASLDEIMRIRPQAAFEGDELVSLEGGQELGEQRVPVNSKCIAAILDGYPVLQHEALSGRVVALEVDVLAADVPVSARLHGTAMASLIVRGDLARAEPPLISPLAVIPVLSKSRLSTETTPPGKLAIGVIYRALNALVLQRGLPESQLSQVVVVNHSICDTQLPFVRATSPWASLIDYFSHHHRLLFVVSAGNITSAVPVSGVSALEELQGMNPELRDALVIGSLRESSGTRGLLCPAETVNGLTIGALHQDGGTPAPVSEIDPFQGLEMVSLNSALGLGINRSVKPDLTRNGGRSSLGISMNEAGQIQIHPARSVAMGHKVARPGLNGESDRYGLSAGTSDAAALTTRSAIQIAAVLDEVFQQDGEQWTQRPARAVMLKTLLVHSARWGDVGALLYKTIMNPDNPAKRQAEKNETTRYIGFGKADPDRVLDGTNNRITLLADDLIKTDERHVFKLPIPAHMLKSRDLRSLTITLTWTTPIVIFSSDYRGVGLKLVDAEGKQIFWKGVKRDEVVQPVQTAMERGTVVHMQLAGSTLWQHGRSDGHALEIGVQAIAKHGSTKGAAVPYALAMTLEVATSVETKIYEQLRNHIRARQQQRSRTILRS